MRARMLASVVLDGLHLPCSAIRAADVSVKGVVTDAKGKPVVGATVSLFYQQSNDQADPAPRQVVQTDDRGGYAFTSPLKFAAAHGTDWADHYVITVSDEAHAPGWALVTGDDPAADRDIILESAERQEIQVKDTDDQPIAGATIQIAYAGDAQDRYPAFRTPANFAPTIGLGAIKTDANGSAMMPLPHATGAAHLCFRLCGRFGVSRIRAAQGCGGCPDDARGNDQRHGDRAGRQAAG